MKQPFISNLQSFYTEKKIVFVSGCYDILHDEHIDFFEEAKRLGDYLVVSIPSDKVLFSHKRRTPSIPLKSKVRILESIKYIDEVVISDNEELGLDFKDHFLRIKPNILAVRQDDKYKTKKIELCEQIGAKYVVLAKDVFGINTTELLNKIKAPSEVPIRVDFAGGWLDVPKLSMEGGYIVNCACSPLTNPYDAKLEIGSGIGGSAAHSIMRGEKANQYELNNGVGWQDASVINETGLCVWDSGKYPKLNIKINPNFLNGKMAIFWTGEIHTTKNLVDQKRNYEAIYNASIIAKNAVLNRSLDELCISVKCSYFSQIEEGMSPLPGMNEKAKKYCGSGWGGYALYIFSNQNERDKFVNENKYSLSIEPYIKSWE